MKTFYKPYIFLYLYINLCQKIDFSFTKAITPQLVTIKISNDLFYVNFYLTILCSIMVCVDKNIKYTIQTYCHGKRVRHKNNGWNNNYRVEMIKKYI